MECSCSLRHIQDSLAIGRTPCEKRFTAPLNGPIRPFGRENVSQTHLTKQTKHRLHQLGEKMLSRILTGGPAYGGWMVRRLACCGLGRPHGIRRSSKKIEVPECTKSPLLRDKCVFPCPGGPLKQDGHVALRPLRHQQLQEDDDLAGDDSDAQNQQPLPPIAEGKSDADSPLPRRPPSVEREATEEITTVYVLF